MNEKNRALQDSIEHQADLELRLAELTKQKSEQEAKHLIDKQYSKKRQDSTSSDDSEIKLKEKPEILAINLANNKKLTF